jgi:hypothetical protein
MVVSDIMALIPTFSILIASPALRGELFPSCFGRNKKAGSLDKELKPGQFRSPVMVAVITPEKAW